MAATVRLGDTAHSPGWKLLVDGQPVSGDWEVRSPFGSVETAVVLDSKGSPVFDRPAYREAPNVNLVVYGKTPTGEVRIAIIRQPRPHADDPEQPGVDGHDPVVFGQVPMGFAEKILGESIEETAKREAAEETGAGVVLSVTRPQYPWHNPNPTFVATWSDLLFVEVDLARVEKLRSSRNEPIYSAEFISTTEPIGRVAAGRDEQGAVYRMCTANSVLFIFFATFPEFWPKS
jgi:ADP-ribose pyrophosphatase YjhB (NUDIX family)